jgi:hypothetical protein
MYGYLPWPSNLRSLSFSLGSVRRSPENAYTSTLHTDFLTFGGAERSKVEPNKLQSTDEFKGYLRKHAGKDQT